MVMSNREEHHSNIPFGMWFTPDGIVKLESDVQEENALSPILVIVVGNSTPDREVQLSKA
jgi:hypothetical protein